MKASNLVTGMLGSTFTPANGTEYMLRNALIEIDRIEAENDDLQKQVDFYENIFKVLKQEGEVNKNQYGDYHYISFSWIREGEYGFDELMQVLGFELPESEPEKAADDEDTEDELE